MPILEQLIDVVMLRIYSKETQRPLSQVKNQSHLCFSMFSFFYYISNVTIACSSLTTFYLKSYFVLFFLNRCLFCTYFIK